MGCCFSKPSILTLLEIERYSYFFPIQFQKNNDISNEL